MGELGQRLRQTREEKGIDLDQVANETRIRVRFLEALEQEDYEALPTPGHVHGFLRNYALYLGLDLGEVQALYDAGNRDGRLVPGIFRPKNIELSPRRPLVRASLVLGLVLFVVVLVIGGWAFWQYGMPVVQPLLDLLTPAPGRTAAADTAAATAAAATVEAAAATQTAATAAALAAVTQTSTATATSTPVESTETPTAAPQATLTKTPAPTATLQRSSPTPTRSSTATPTPSPTPVEGVTLAIVVIERAWMQVTLDGQEQPGELLEVGAERTWEADRSIRLVCGNAGGIEVVVNGQELGTLGRRAEVVERTWTPQGEATPTPAPS